MIEYQKGKPKPRTIETPYQQQLDVRVQNLPKLHPPLNVTDKAFEQLQAQERVKQMLIHYLNNLKQNEKLIHYLKIHKPYLIMFKV